MPLAVALAVHRSLLYNKTNKWRAKVEVSFLRRCVDPHAPKEPLDADAQAEADGGEDEAPPDEESDDGSVAGSSPGGSSPHSSQGSLGA